MDLMALSDLEYTLLMLSAYAAIALFFVYRWFKNRDKMLVRIKYAKEKKMLVTPEEDGKVKLGAPKSLGKAKGFSPAWRVDFDMTCLYFSGTIFKRLTIDVMPDAKRAIPYFKPLEEKDIPKWTRKEHEDHAKLDVLGSLRSLGEQKTSIVLWIIVILVIISIMLPFLTSGRIRF